MFCVCLMFCIPVSRSVYLSHVLCTCLMFCVSVSCSVYLSHVLCTCLMFCVSVSCYVYPSHVLCTCLMFCVSVTCSVYLSHYSKTIKKNLAKFIPDYLNQKKYTSTSQSTIQPTLILFINISTHRLSLAPDALLRVKSSLSF